MFTLDSIAEQINESLEDAVFFVGAGISVDSGLPEFCKLNKEILRLLACPEMDRIAEIRPEIVLQVLNNELMPVMGKKYLSFLDAFRDEKYMPNANHFLMAEILKKGGIVITTNWDDLIEKACNEKDIQFCVTHTNYQFENFLKNKSKNKIGHIIKIHGDINYGKYDDPYGSIQMTLNDVGQGLNYHKRKLLEELLQTHDFFFMGYSGMDDFDILPILTETKSDKNVTWIDHVNENSIKILERAEIEEESGNKIPEEPKDFEIKNPNDVLLGRAECKKIQAYTKKISSKIMDLQDNSTTRKPTFEFGNNIVHMFNNLEQDTRNFILGTLYEKCFEVDRATDCLSCIIRNGNDIAKAHYRLGMMLDRLKGKKAKRPILENYDMALQNTSDPCKKAEILVSCANFHRRVSQEYEKALELIKRAEKMAECNNNSFLLNIKALTYFGMQNLDKAEKIASDGSKIRGGDVVRIAQSLNTLGLIKMEKENFEDAIKDFEDALDINMRIGEFRPCGQQCLNLIRCYARLLKKCAQDDIEQVMLCGTEYYKRSSNYWKKKMSRTPIKEEIMEGDLRYAELLCAYVSRINQDRVKSENVQEKIKYIHNRLQENKKEYIKISRDKKVNKKIELCDAHIKKTGSLIKD